MRYSLISIKLGPCHAVKRVSSRAAQALLFGKEARKEEKIRRVGVEYLGGWRWTDWVGDGGYTVSSVVVTASLPSNTGH